MWEAEINWTSKDVIKMVKKAPKKWTAEGIRSMNADDLRALIAKNRSRGVTMTSIARGSNTTRPEVSMVISANPGGRLSRIYSVIADEINSAEGVANEGGLRDS